MKMKKKKKKKYIRRQNISNVTCYAINGEKLWEFKDESVLKQPIGVAFDNNCNIYVTSYYYNKVIVLSPDGKQWRQLLDQNDGMSCPYAISMDITNLLLCYICFLSHKISLPSYSKMSIT